MGPLVSLDHRQASGVVAGKLPEDEQSDHVLAPSSRAGANEIVDRVIESLDYRGWQEAHRWPLGTANEQAVCRQKRRAIGWKKRRHPFVPVLFNIAEILICNSSLAKRDPDLPCPTKRLTSALSPGPITAEFQQVRSQPAKGARSRLISPPIRGETSSTSESIRFPRLAGVI
jgi:hypothetical protein